MFNQKLDNERKELEVVLTEREKNLVRMRFDLFYAVKRYKEVQPRFEKLSKEKIRLQEELNLQNQMGGKTTKTKEKILENEKQLKDINNELQKIVEIYQDIKQNQKVIPLAEKMIETLKDCIKNPQKIYDVQFSEENIQQKNVGGNQEGRRS